MKKKEDNQATKSQSAVHFVAHELNSLRDQKKAIEMAAYMKTTMPFYGVQKPDRVPIFRELKAEYRPDSSDEYLEIVSALWSQRYREEKYFAINYAEAFTKYIEFNSLLLYEQIIREGSWWDFVDPVATNLIGLIYKKQRKELKPIIEKWSHDSDFWIRRTSLLVHLKHKQETDVDQLFEFCLRMAPEKEFFIRKAIGWSLREYAKTDPKNVLAFLKKNKDALSTLSFREASKHLGEPIG